VIKTTIKFPVGEYWFMRKTSVRNAVTYIDQKNKVIIKYVKYHVNAKNNNNT